MADVTVVLFSTLQNLWILGEAEHHGVQALLASLQLEGHRPVE